MHKNTFDVATKMEKYERGDASLPLVQYYIRQWLAGLRDIEAGPRNASQMYFESRISSP